MPNYFYFDQLNQKQGPVSEQQLKDLVARGIIGPNSPMETDTGHKGTAGQIPGLFPAASVPPPFTQPPKIDPASPPSAAQLFCTNCGSPVHGQAFACRACGVAPVGYRKFCRQCGAAFGHIAPNQLICTSCGAKIPRQGIGFSLGTGSKNKMVAGLLGILLGGVGVHKFYMGSWGWGLLFLAYDFILLPILILVISVLAALTFGLLTPLVILVILVPGVVGIVEGIIFLTMSEENFAAKYPPETQAAFRW